MPHSTGDPERARFGVIDIGSNTIRLVVFDDRTRSPAYFFNEKDTAMLGAGLQATGALYPEGRTRGLEVLKRFRALAEAMNVKMLEVVATAAIRDASDGAEFAEEIREQTGLPVRVIDGMKEGRYSAMGVLLGEARWEGVVLDIGGASMEITSIHDGEVGSVETTPLGPLRLAATGLSNKKLDEFIHILLETHWPDDAPKKSRMTLVGGGWRAFAMLDMARRSYPLHVLHAYEMSPQQALTTAAWARKADEVDLLQAGVSKTRAANMPLTAQVLEQVIAFAKPKIIGISGYGLREGILFENLSKDMRASDPLLQSAGFMEQMFARFPGFGEELEAWLAPLFTDLPARLRIAACLLADVNWRVHPDYRASACFATATQASLAGLTHRERVMLAVSLAYRYKGAQQALLNEPACVLLDDDDRAIAEALGRTIRLGAMLSGATTGVLRQTAISREEDRLRLDVDRSCADLIAGAVEKRLASLAAVLGLTPELRVA